MSSQPKLSLHDIGQANRKAQMNGLQAGALTGFAAAVFGARVMKLNGNSTVLTGLVTFAASSLLFTRSFLAARLTRLEDEYNGRRRIANPDDPDPWHGS